VVPGKTVVVDNGTYTGSNPTGCVSAQSCYVVLISTSGTAAKPITFKAANSLGASINGNGFSSQYCIGMNTGVAYVNIIGFDVTHCGVSGISINSAGNHDIVIANNHVEHIAEINTCSTIGNAGINVGQGTYNITIDSNTVNDVGRLATSGCSPNSLAFTNDHLLYLKGYNQTITNNVLFDAHSGWSIQLACGPPPDGPGWLIANNTIGASNNPQAYGDIVLDDTGAGIATSSGTISNNISIAPATVFFDLFNPHPGSTWTMDNNLFGTNVVLAAGAGAANATIATAGTLNNTNPLVYNATPPTPNFELQPGSPAIGAGIYLPTVTHDFTGAPRGNPPSIGAFEQ
jgi:hypothetical protein